jgi:hypothetical protein
MSRYEYKLIDTTTVDGLKEAEKLKEDGWKIQAVGFSDIQFEKKLMIVSRQ